jgi:ADP-ribose pyrophosphatase YjhB (NUDIX family)
VALGVIRVDDELLVFRGYDQSKDETYYRPLGGTIDFGEHSEAAIRRELREELNVRVVLARLLGVIENAFTVNGQPGHEIDFIYEVSVVEIDRLRAGPIVAAEADGSPLTCLAADRRVHRQRTSVSTRTPCVVALALPARGHTAYTSRSTEIESAGEPRRARQIGHRDPPPGDNVLECEVQHQAGT